MNTHLKPLVAKLSPLSRRALEAAASLAVTRSHYEIDLEHVLLALLQEPQSDLLAILKVYGVAPGKVETHLRKALDALKSGNTRNPVLAWSVPRWLQAGWLTASVDFDTASLGSGHLLLALLEDEQLTQLLNGAADDFARVSPDDLRKQMPSILHGSQEIHVDRPRASGRESQAAPRHDIATPALDQYTIDLTAEARAGKIDPILGRDHEIRQMIDILLRRRQNNPILTGEPGVGKTAVVEGLALRIANGDVPDALKNACLRTLDLGLLQAGASVKGEFENRLRGVIGEVKASLVPLILFIDEAHTMIGAGGQVGQNDAANMLKPVLARGELRTIAATTWSEYKKYFEKDAALARRFQVVKVEEPVEDDAIQMVRGIAGTLEKHHGVRILDEAVVDAVKLSSRYLAGRQLPDKAVSVLDTACARVALSRATCPAPLEDVVRLIENIDRELNALEKERDNRGHDARIAELRAKRVLLEADRNALDEEARMQQQLVERIRKLRDDLTRAADAKPKTVEALRTELNSAQRALHEAHDKRALIYDCVDAATIAEVIAGWTGIPLGRMVADEIDTVRNLRALLEKRVIGQSHALDLIARRIQIARASLEDPAKPTGVFLLVGPSGVGKTETALALAEALYGGERNLITINMSEYQEAHTVSSLKGSPPGYVGYGEGGVLTEAVRRRPYSVVLLDEVEKAHPDVLELFFQVFDKGVLEDAEGHVVDFKHTIIILTSNVGTDLIMQAVKNGVKVNGKNRAPTLEDLAVLLRGELQQTFKPAFLGRLTVVPYYPVQDAALRQIVRLKLDKVATRMRGHHGAKLAYGEDVVTLIAGRCVEVDSGARNADAIIANTVMSDLSTRILARMAEDKPVKAARLTVSKGELRTQLS